MSAPVLIPDCQAGKSVLFTVVNIVMGVPRACRAHGWRFDHAAFIASFRSARTRAFLGHLRESQCYEVFINERLRMASQDYADIDSFEAKVPSVNPWSRHQVLTGHVLQHDGVKVAVAGSIPIP